MGIAATLTFTSCKKDEELSKTEMLTTGSWIQVGATEDGQDVWDADYEDCEKDDITTFSSDGTFTIDEGATKCNPSDPQISDSGTWELSSDEKTITIKGFPAEIITLTSADLVVKIDLLGTNTTATFKKQ